MIKAAAAAAAAAQPTPARDVLRMNSPSKRPNVGARSSVQSMSIKSRDERTITKKLGKVGAAFGSSLPTVATTSKQTAVKKSS